MCPTGCRRPSTENWKKRNQTHNTHNSNMAAPPVDSVIKRSTHSETTTKISASFICKSNVEIARLLQQNLNPIFQDGGRLLEIGSDWCNMADHVGNQTTDYCCISKQWQHLINSLVNDNFTEFITTWPVAFIWTRQSQQHDENGTTFKKQKTSTYHFFSVYAGRWEKWKIEQSFRARVYEIHRGRKLTEVCTGTSTFIATGKVSHQGRQSNYRDRSGAAAAAAWKQKLHQPNSQSEFSKLEPWKSKTKGWAFTFNFTGLWTRSRFYSWNGWLLPQD